MTFDEIVKDYTIPPDHEVKPTKDRVRVFSIVGFFISMIGFSVVVGIPMYLASIGSDDIYLFPKLGMGSLVFVLLFFLGVIFGHAAFDLFPNQHSNIKDITLVQWMYWIFALAVVGFTWEYLGSFFDDLGYGGQWKL